MYFVKNFSLTLDRGLQLKNISDLEAYITEKIDHFSKYENYSNKEERLMFIDEIIQMCAHDRNTATFDYSALPTIEGANMTELQVNMIDFFNIASVFGAVFLNVFDKGENRLSRIEDGISGPIQTNRMFLHAYNELVACKNNGCVPAYGATLILATLFEKDIKDHTKRIYARNT